MMTLARDKINIKNDAKANSRKSIIKITKIIDISEGSKFWPGIK